MTEEERKEFAKYIIETVVEDSVGMMDVVELYDSWYNQDQRDPELDEQEASLILDLVHRSIIDVYWPLV